MNPCPKCAYVRQPYETHVHPGICPGCGIAYEKWSGHAYPMPVEPAEHLAPTDENEEGEAPLSWPEYIQASFAAVPAYKAPEDLWGRAVVWVALALWAGYFTLHGVHWEYIGGSFLHNIDLAFHEFGHVFFSPFGHFMMILGGSLFQVLLPLALLLVFTFYQGDNFGASVMLWWCGQSFVDLSPYIQDAEYRALPLVGNSGEESHDWGNLLTMLDAVSSCYKLANTSFGLGVLLMAAGLAWGAYLLWQMNLHRQA